MVRLGLAYKEAQQFFHLKDRKHAYLSFELNLYINIRNPDQF